MLVRDIPDTLVTELPKMFLQEPVYNKLISPYQSPGPDSNDGPLSAKRFRRLKRFHLPIMIFSKSLMRPLPSKAEG